MRRLSALVVAGALFGVATPAGAEQVPGIPGLEISTMSTSQTLSTPAAVTSSTWAASSQGVAGSNYIHCLAFRVLSRKPVASVKFNVRFVDDFGNSHFSWDMVRRASSAFSPGVVVPSNYSASTTYTNDGDQSCWVIPVGRDLDTGRANIRRGILETRQVAFTDGTVWNAGNSFDQAFAPDGSRYPQFRLTNRFVNQDRAPIQVLGASTGYDFDGTPKQCVSYRNVAPAAASRVKFTFRYADVQSQNVFSWWANDDGTFTSPVRIDDHCWRFGVSSDQIKRMAFDDLHVSHVWFKDGTEWDEGQNFTRAFGTDGSPMSPTLVSGNGGVAPQPGGGGGNLPPVITGGVGGGGQRFGAFALDPTATIWAFAPDRESAGLAQVDAIDQCNAKVGAQTCTSPLQFGGGATLSPGSWSPCGAIAVVRSGITVVLTGMGNSKREAEAQALNKAGSSGGNATILTSGCNSQ
jgi:hypothetical protein